MKKLKSVLSFLISTVMTAVLLIPLSSYALTVTEISDSAQLLAVKEYGSYRLARDIDMTGFSGESVIPVFNGELDGNGHAITNLSLSSAGGNTGFIGKLTGKVTGLTVRASIYTDSNGTAYTGGIAGINIGLIDSCISEIVLTADVTGTSYIGGISGINRYFKSNGTVSMSSASGSITLVNQTGSVTSMCFIGGISGAFGNITLCSNGVTLNADCVNAGIVYAGGISAYESAVKYCENTGSITAGAFTQAYAGGICAFFGSSERVFVQNSVNSGHISSKIYSVVSDPLNEDIQNVYCSSGGITAYMANTAPVQSTVIEGECTSILRNCTNTGEVTADRQDGSLINCYAGGIAGIVNGLVYACTVSDSAVSALINGQIFAAVNRSGILRGKIRDCYAFESQRLFAPVSGNADTVTDITVLSVDDMRNPASFDGFDFNSVWTIDDTVGMPVPLLLPGHTHSFTEADFFATATAEAYTVFTCSGCKCSYTSIHHSFGEYTNNNDGDCTQNATETACCSFCGIENTRIIENSSLGHDWVETGRTEPTCTEDGVINYVCSRDATHTKTEPIIKLGHSWDTEWTVDVAPTADTAGSKSHHCTRCDEKTDVTVIDALGHNFAAEFTVDIEPTCETAGSKSRHCTDTNCDAKSEVTVIDPLGHDWVETISMEANCFEDGFVNYICSHDSSHRKTVTIPTLGHSWDTDFTVDLAPTCETAGSKSIHCSACDETKDTSVIDALGHDWVETGRTDATCTEDGVINYACSHDATHTKNEPIIKLGHSWDTEWTVDVAPTADTAGSKSHHCTRCDEKTDVTVIDALGHNFAAEFTVDIEPTCETAGSKSRHCTDTNCDAKSEVTVIDPLGHDWVETGRTDATCTEDGVINYACSHDATHTKNEPIIKLGHSWDTDFTVDVAPTCETAGSKSIHCSACDETKDTSVIDALGHDYGEYIYNNDATYWQDGTKTATCARCGEKDTVTAEGTKPPFENSSEKFSDVPQDKWFKTYIDYAVSLRLFNGTSDTTFEPETPMSRAMFVRVLANLEGIDTEAMRNEATRFTDVAVGKWYTGAVKWASENAIVNGISATEFAPEKSISRQEMCTMLTRYARFKGIILLSVNAKLTFADDAEISNYAKDSVYQCRMAGLINGMTETEFAPRDIATRAQVAKILSIFHKDYIG